MIACMENTIVLTEAERMELNQRASSRSGRADDARRARLILLLEAGHTWATIREKLDCNDAFIDRWMKRFPSKGVLRGAESCSINFWRRSATWSGDPCASYRA